MRLRRLVRRFQARWVSVLQSDTAFIEEAYKEILQRPADQDGVNHYRAVLRDGLSRTAVLLSLVRSQEFLNSLVPNNRTLPNLRDIRPAQFRVVIDRTNGDSIPAFAVNEPADFDWLETAILENKYYEQPGVWNFGIDTDKQVVAEIVAAFQPARALELGCAAGAVLECLEQYGVTAEGVEISAMARDRASDRVRSRIHGGDLLALDGLASYNVVFGLDVFEHLNPNRIDGYLTRLCDVTSDEGYVFCNIPAFGEDPIFGTVFPLYIDSWARDATEGRPFSMLHVDELGYPLHGHLTWADARWWVKRFESHGLQREEAIEQALHQKYDRYMDKRSVARKAYFVFSKNRSDQLQTRTIQRINRPSRVLVNR